jgi:hypothetical protein
MIAGFSEDVDAEQVESDVTVEAMGDLKLKYETVSWAASTFNSQPFGRQKTLHGLGQGGMTI